MEKRSALDEATAQRATADAGMVCMTCFDKADWKSALLHGCHGCSKCQRIFDEKHWGKDVLKKHRSTTIRRDLVCPECQKNGFSAGHYEEYTCGQCLTKLGSSKTESKFDSQQLKDVKKGQQTRLVCKDWND